MIKKEVSGFEELSLKKVKIHGNVIGKFGDFTIEQTFINNTKKHLEVNYTFPITETAVVTGFTVKVGDKEMYGVCKEKEEARKEYVENISSGNSAYMLEQDTANVFNVMVGRVLPDEEVKIKITYIDMYTTVDNKIRLIIPTLVNQRYKSIITNGLKYGKVDYTVDFKININKTAEYTSIDSINHKIEKEELENNIIITANNYDMSRDFVLDMRIKNAPISNACYSLDKDNNKTLLLNFMPEIDEEDNNPKEYIFVVDVSGSMASSNKIGKTKEALKRCLKELKEGDKFNILPFESEYTFYNLESVEATEQNKNNAMEFIDELHANGGTEILDPLKFALYEKLDNKVVIVLTDGEVGNEDEITNFISKYIYNGRLFALGIDTSVNTAFIKAMAKAGNGKAEFIYPDEDMEEAIVKTFARIQSPLVRNVEIDYGKNKLISEIKEETTLFNHEFFQAIVKVEDVVDDITLKAHVGEKIYVWKIRRENISKYESNLELIYAKKKIDIFEEQIRSYEGEYNKNARKLAEEFKKRIVKISCEYIIASKYTSFISVNERNEKAFEPTCFENITLSDRELSYDCCADVSFFSVNRKCAFKSSGGYVLDDTARDNFAYQEECIAKGEGIEKRIEKDWGTYDVMTSLLSIIFLHEIDSELPVEKMFKELINTLNVDWGEPRFQRVLYYMYSNFIFEDYILDKLLTGVYKKLAITNASYDMSLEKAFYDQNYPVFRDEEFASYILDYLKEGE